MTSPRLGVTELLTTDVATELVDRAYRLLYQAKGGRDPSPRLGPPVGPMRDRRGGRRDAGGPRRQWNDLANI